MTSLKRRQSEFDPLLDKLQGSAANQHDDFYGTKPKADINAHMIESKFIFDI